MRTIHVLLLTFASLAYAWTIETPTEYEKNIRSYLHLKLGPETEWAKTPALMVIFTEDALKPYGYMHPHITLNLQKKIMSIHTGEAVTIADTQIILDKNCIGVHAPKHTMTGHIFRNDVYAKLKESLLTQAHNLGYYDAQVTGHVVIADNKAFIDLNMQCYMPYILKDIQISSPFHSTLYTQHAQHSIGKPAGSIDFNTFKSTIRQRSYLGQHEITEELDPATHTVTWNVLNRSIPPNHSSVGAGFISGKGLDIIAQYTTIYKPYASSSTIVSHISTQTIDGLWVYSFPSTWLVDGLHSIKLFHEIFPNHRFNQISQSEVSYRLMQVDENHRTEYGLTFQYNRDKPEDTIVTSHALYPYILRDNAWQEGHSTHQFNWMVKASSQLLGSNLNFLSATADYHYRSTHFATLLLKADVSLAGIIHGKYMQDSWLFRTGGPISVMGYPVDSIGPGNYLSVGRLGLFYPISNGWYIGYWFTSGNASDTLSLPNHIGQAVAVDIQTPVGAIEIALAKTKDHSIQFSLNLLPL